MPIRHRVKPGECVSSIAFTYGFFPATIWLHADNRALRATRDNPNTLLADDDVVVVPDKRERAEAVATDARHVFRRRGVPEQLRLRLLDEDGEPRKQLAYRLTVDGHELHGATDDAGQIVVWIAPDAGRGRLVLGDGADEEVHALWLGWMPPISTPAGVRERLRNLGYLAQDEPSEDDVQAALAAFEAAEGLALSDGPPGPATRSALQAAHGS